jgi:hypothetical protein
MPVTRIPIRLGIVVLVGVPESAIVSWINAHRGVIAPAMTRCAAAHMVLRAAARLHLHFSLRQRIRGITCQPPGVSNTWKIRARSVRSGVAQGHVAVMVGGDAAHPAIDRHIRCVDLLLNGRGGHRPASDIDLRPLRTFRRGYHGVMHYPKRFGGAYFPVLHFLHDAVVN